MNKTFVLLGLVGVSASGFAQVPDVLNTLDAGSRSMGAGGAFGVTSSDTFSILNNPAGLGYITTRTSGLAVRSLPTSTSTYSGSLSNRRVTSLADRGRNNLSHLGYAVPLKNGSVIGVSYQIGGFINDSGFGTGLTEGTLTNITIQESFRAQTDFYTVSLGKASKDGYSSFGYGITFANTYVKSQLISGIPGNPATILEDVNFSGRANGVGLVAGYQMTSKKDPNTSFGFSLRTPITLSGNKDVTSVIERIPGQFSLGFAKRVDNFRNSGNSLVYGLQVNQIFGAEGAGPADRNGNVLTYGYGAEYSLVKDEVTYPIRLGYMSNPGGGDRFTNRNGLTFGLGYRRNGTPWTVDLNYMYPRGAAADFALAFNYRFEK
jgi:hypothetical protein